MINDQTIMQAVTSLIQRAERRDEQKSIQTFVDPGILARTSNANHQIIFGRRGTGKTHVFQVLGSAFRADSSNVVVYLDARTLGSTAQFCDQSVAIPARCTSLFRDVVYEVYKGLLQHIVYQPPPGSEQAVVALDALDQLFRVATEHVPVSTEQVVSGREKETARKGGELGASLSTSAGGILSGTVSSSRSSETENSVARKVTLQDKVRFPPLHQLINEVLEKANAKLVVLFDEWASIPIEVQPYLAEFLKRSFLPSRRVLVKIASLEYRSRFLIGDALNSTGFELGSDISADVDLDDYYVFDRNPEKITSIMADILFKHLRSELPEGYLEATYGITSGDVLASRMFTQRPAFQELVRASEGVVRDLINIFTKAYFDAQRRSKNNIDQKAITQAARDWFETDKKQNLDSELDRVLTRIVDDVIGEHRARSFLTERDLEKHPVMQRLFDARIIHLVQKGYADKDNPGRRYNIYTLDYGTYVDLIHTSKEPEQYKHESSPEDDMKNRIVPFDDKRSIRRVILTKQALD